jgi:hypothetical protein
MRIFSLFSMSALALVSAESQLSRSGAQTMVYLYHPKPARANLNPSSNFFMGHPNDDGIVKSQKSSFFIPFRHGFVSGVGTLFNTFWISAFAGMTEKGPSISFWDFLRFHQRWIRGYQRFDEPAGQDYFFMIPGGFYGVRKHRSRPAHPARQRRPGQRPGGLRALLDDREQAHGVELRA